MFFGNRKRKVVGHFYSQQISTKQILKTLFRIACHSFFLTRRMRYQCQIYIGLADMFFCFRALMIWNDGSYIYYLTPHSIYWWKWDALEGLLDNKCCYVPELNIT